jgi:hypothetical protein
MQDDPDHAIEVIKATAKSIKQEVDQLSGQLKAKKRMLRHYENFLRKISGQPAKRHQRKPRAEKSSTPMGGGNETQIS